MKKVFLSIAVLCMAAACLPVKSETIEKFRFRVTVDSMQFMFQEVTGIAIEPQAAKSNSANSRSPVAMPGIKKTGNVIANKGVVANTKMSADYLTLKLPPAKKSNITVELLDEKGKASMTWILSNAYPVKIVKAAAKATDKEITIETIEFAHEGMTVKK